LNQAFVAMAWHYPRQSAAIRQQQIVGVRVTGRRTEFFSTNPLLYTKPTKQTKTGRRTEFFGGPN
jgi:hypothetical protein